MSTVKFLQKSVENPKTHNCMKNCNSPSEWASPHYTFDLLLSNTGVAHCRIFIDRKKTENQFSLTILPLFIGKRN